MSRAGSTFEVARDALGADLRSRWASDSQARRILRFIERFEVFCLEAFDVSALEGVDAAIVQAFVGSACSDGCHAGHSVQRARRSAIRLLFQSARRLGLVGSDPTVDVALPPLTSLRARPLTDDEVIECRATSAWSLTSARRSLTWALAESTCRSGEIPNVRVRDIDLEHGRVVIRGGGRCAPRTGRLTDWGRNLLGEHLTAATDPDAPLVYSGGTARLGGLVSANAAISQVLQRAGLGDEPDVRPSSVVAWAGAKVLERTGRIECVADALGLKSLDSAALFIGWDWQTDPGGAGV